VQYLLFYAEIIDKNRKNRAYADLGHISGLSPFQKLSVNNSISSELHWLAAHVDNSNGVHIIKS